MRDEDFFWEGAREGRLLVQRCADCGTLRHPPAPMCAACHGLAVERVACSGRGELCGWLLSRHPSRHVQDEGRIVARLRMEEGFYLVANLLDLPLDALHEGMAVQVSFADVNGKVVPQCRRVARA